MLQSPSPSFGPRALDFFTSIVLHLFLFHGQRLGIAGRRINSAARCQLGRSLGIIIGFQFCKLLRSSEASGATDLFSVLCAQVL